MIFMPKRPILGWHIVVSFIIIKELASFTEKNIILLLYFINILLPLLSLDIGPFQVGDGTQVYLLKMK